MGNAKEAIGMRILITGDKGFVGAETKKLLSGIMEDENTGEVKEWTYEDKMEKYLRPVHEVFGYDLMDGYDIRDIEQFESVVKECKPVRVLHLAAIARFSEADKDPRLAYETNALGTENVAQVAEKYHIPVVYASTGSVYMPITQKPPITEEFEAKGNSVYACSKYLGETSIRRLTPHIILRYAHLYGKEKRHHGLIGGFMSRIERGLSPTLYGGKQSNDFCYIRDIARANLLALTAPWDAWNQTYNIGTGQEITAEEAGRIICELSGYKGEIERKEARTVDPEHFVYDTSKAERMLGFKAEYDFKKGLQDMFSKG